MTLTSASLLWILLLQTQQPQSPPPPGSRGSANLISGSVVPADAAEPLASANVTLRPLDESTVTSSAGRGATRLQSRSDALGKFSLSVPPGRYGISVDREGYVPEDRFQFGLNQPPQSVLTVVNGQRIENLIVTMNSAPAISGVVYGPQGERVAAATVQAYRVHYTPYGRQLVPTLKVLSHEGGEYRLFDLSPGYYYVSAS